MSEEAKDPRDSREARLGAALRENLRRRKAQARGRTGPTETKPAEAEPPRDTSER